MPIGKTIIAVAAAFVLGGLSALAIWFTADSSDRAGATATPGQPVWTEVRWPFLLDEWGTGKAFRCKPADCGAEVNVYLRAKIGFCNCTTGVSDDDELARVGDVALIGGRSWAVAPGHAIAVAWMKGRSRPYTVRDAVTAGESALEMAMNDHCDAIVATIVVGHGDPVRFEQTVVTFLNSDAVLRWTRRTLGL